MGPHLTTARKSGSDDEGEDGEAALMVLSPAKAASVQSDPPIHTGIDTHLSKISDRLLECTFAVLLPKIRTVVRWKALEHSF